MDQAISLDPQLAPAYVNRGVAHKNLGQLQRAIQDYDEATRLDPQNPVAYSNRGNAYATLGRYQRAIQEYEEAIRLDPQYAIAYSNRGKNYRDLGQPQNANADQDKACRLDKKYCVSPTPTPKVIVTATPRPTPTRTPRPTPQRDCVQVSQSNARSTSSGLIPVGSIKYNVSYRLTNVCSQRIWASTTIILFDGGGEILASKQYGRVFLNPGQSQVGTQVIFYSGSALDVKKFDIEARWEFY